MVTRRLASFFAQSPRHSKYRFTIIIINNIMLERGSKSDLVGEDGRQWRIQGVRGGRRGRTTSPFQTFQRRGFRPIWLAGRFAKKKFAYRRVFRVWRRYPKETVKPCRISPPKTNLLDPPLRVDGWTYAKLRIDVRFLCAASYDKRRRPYE